MGGAEGGPLASLQRGGSCGGAPGICQVPSEALCRYGSYTLVDQVPPEFDLTVTHKPGITNPSKGVLRGLTGKAKPRAGTGPQADSHK